MPPRKQRHRKKHHPEVNGELAKAAVDNGVPETQTCQKLEDERAKLPYIIEHSNIVGRYIVASRDLKPGELLITAPPLAIGPCVSKDPVCLGCYMPVILKASQFRCRTCRWPMCGPNCPGLHRANGHTSEECALHASKRTADTLSRLQSSTVEVKNLYELVLIIRILLMKEHSAENYAAISLMESHLELRKQNTELWSHYEENVVRRLRNEWHMLEYSEAEIHTICGILDVNCFEIGQSSAKARTLYPHAYLLAHDCSPNTSHTDMPHTYEILLRTSRHVARGEALTLSYAYTLQGTLKRRDFMNAGKLFWCQCERCADRFELGTDCSAIVCSKCQKGSVRPLDPLSQAADWGCDSCEFKLIAKDVTLILDRINDDLDAIDVHDVPGLENYLKRYRQVLCPNHYLLLSAKYSLCQIYGRIEGYLLPDMSLEDMRRKELYCREFLGVIDKLEPGMTRLRGLILYELHAPIMMISQRLMLSNMITKQEFQRNLKAVVQLLHESRDILKMEPIGSNEYQMALAAEDALIKMRSK